jgi:hypothetical protein
MVFKVSANAGVFLLPLLFVLPPTVFKGRKKESAADTQAAMKEII